MPEDNQLELKKHRKLIRICLAVLPSDYAVFQTSKPTVLFFLLSSLELLGDLDRQLSAAAKRRMISSVYSLQLKPQQLTSDLPLHKCGFLGSASCSTDPNVVCPYDGAHIAQTYTALCSLLLLGDDLAQVDRVSLLKALRCFQSEDGSFFGTGDGHSENDMRFVFCASAICYILDDFAQIDVESMCAFIRRSVNYDGGIGQGPGLESHGGSTFCAVAALALVGRLWDGTVLGGAQLERLKGWLLLKQGQGFHGRTNKPDDSCYAFWIGATLTMLNAQSLINWPALRSFLLRMQDPTIGGFCKFDGSSHSDILHTYFSLASFGLFGEPHIQPVFPALNISSRVHERLQRLKRSRDADLK